MTVGPRYWLGILSAGLAGGVVGVLQDAADWGQGTLFVVSAATLVVICVVAFGGPPTRRPPHRDGRGPTAS